MKKRIVKITISIVVAGVLLCGATIGAMVWYIHKSVRENCQVAQQAHPHTGDDTAALIDFMNSESHSFQDRTHLAIWTLGRLGTSRALPALESAYTGEVCDHERKLCQYELEKAIKRCGGTPNPPRKIKH